MSLLTKLSDMGVDTDLVDLDRGTYRLLSRYGDGPLASFKRRKVGGGWDFCDEATGVHEWVATMTDLVLIVANLDASY